MVEVVGQKSVGSIIGIVIGIEGVITILKNVVGHDSGSKLIAE